ncbi:A24 family peptidase [Streptomyces sp. DSM 41014]|uniref:A24 family peptidase n=1 Tax=Streptomyces hintoniae TaxID=3075521 RepID=A0ABU2UQ27_9ACTN|nr:A24 family peptidase [Streptomyces sp. DSM 41014]MDT0475385.1 A24 family peptidase [Streptomyces sp. DSM 41014]
MSTGLLIAVAALWGATAGALLPRAAYRFSAPTGEPWHDTCPEGHPVRGWVGRAGCARCARSGRGARSEQGAWSERGAPAEGSAPVEGSAPAGERAPAEGSAPVAGGAPAAPVPGSAGRSHRAEADSPTGTSDHTEATSHTAPGHVPPGEPSPLPLALVTALLCVLLAVATGTRPELGVWLVLAPLGVLLTVVDLRVQRLPDPLTLPLAGAALALLGGAALLPEHAGEWLTALYGALALGLAFFVLFLINPGGMGFGDVKLALGLGAVLGWYGWPTLMLGTFAAFLLGAVYGVALVVTRRAGRKTAIAFGPFLLAGAFLALLTGAYTA